MRLTGKSSVPALNDGRRFPMAFEDWLPSALAQGFVSAGTYYRHYRRFQSDFTGITLSDNSRTRCAFRGYVDLLEKT